MTVTLLVFYTSIAIMSSTGRDAVLGLIFALSTTSAAAVGAFFYTDTFAFPMLAAFTDFILIVNAAALTFSLTTYKRGPFGWSAHFVDRTESYQNLCFVFACLTAGLLLSIATEWSLDSQWKPLRAVAESKSTLRLQIPFLSGFIVISGISYLTFCVGMSSVSPLDAVTVLTLPTRFRWQNGAHLFLIALWSVLTYVGYARAPEKNSRNSLRQSSVSPEMKELLSSPSTV